ncbi:MAG: hypothetical protein WCX88_01795 [Patescibacteria group bacterium]
MISTIPNEITIASFSVIGALSAYVWNDQSVRIKKIEEEQQKCPFPNIKIDIAEMKTDIKWILKNMQK